MAYHRSLHGRDARSMNRVTLASGAFLLFALGVAWWALTRPASPDASVTGDAGVATATALGLTFAEWSVRNDAILLADIDPGAGTSTVPRRFTVFTVRDTPGEPVVVRETSSFSWAPKDRVASTAALSELGFHVSADGIAFTPPGDALFSDPIVHVDSGPGQRVILRSKSGRTTPFTRSRGAYWNKRAIGFPSSDGNLVYITPDATVISASPTLPP
jgi:hypothetical protein